MWKTGVCSISFRKYSIQEIIDAAASAGLDGIEWGSDVHAPCRDEQRLTEIVALQQKYGIRCCSYGTYFRAGVDAPEDIEPYIKAAKRLGTDVLRIWCGSKDSEKYTAEQKEALFEQCRAIARIAQREGVTVCMECHHDTFTNSLDGALALMQAVDSEHFRMYWQPNQHVSVQRNLAYAKAIAPYTKVIHVFHWKGEGKYPLSEATALWGEYLAPFAADVPLLLEFMPDGRPESLIAEARALYDIAEGKP